MQAAKALLKFFKDDVDRDFEDGVHRGPIVAIATFMEGVEV
jgi:hypothetical protein